MRLKIPYFIFCICLYKIFTAQNVIEINIDSIPSHIKQNVNRKYSGYKIRYCSKLIDSNKQLSYNIILQKRDREIDLTYSESGKLVSLKKSKFYTDDEPLKETNYKTPFPNL